MTREESSRINGAKSNGPVSDEGKERSSRNRTCHGLAGNTIVLPGESQEMFDQLSAEYVNEYKPQTPTERDFLTEVVVCTWRLRRIYSMEHAELALEMARQEPQVEKEWNNIDGIGRITLAFERLSDEGKSLALMSRYETRHRRARERALAELLAAIARRPKPDISPIAPSAQPDATPEKPLLPFEPEQPEAKQNNSPAAPIAPMAFTTCTAESLIQAPEPIVATVLNHMIEEERAIENLYMTA